MIKYEDGSIGYEPGDKVKFKINGDKGWVIGKAVDPRLKGPKVYLVRLMDLRAINVLEMELEPEAKEEPNA